ncbi:hypothetical protein ACPEER_09130 [Pasteurella sp. PK-2025]|uniref:hypothetical protein n=1 Tax=unclassified Pasteurella TaxID=2621516 RepID=UPI003C73B543
MKPVINVAVALLLSLGLVACGGGGGSTSNNNAAAVNPNLPKDDVNYIELNNSNSRSFTLEDEKEEKIEKTYTTLSAYKKNNDLIIGGLAKERTPVSQKNELMKLDAKYKGTTFITINGNNPQIEQRSVFFTLKDNKISGHSVKTSADDVQVLFKETQVKELEKSSSSPKVNYLGFEGDGNLQKAQRHLQNIKYFGEFAGQNGEEIAGGFIASQRPDTQPKVSGGFIATREVAAESTPAPKQ